jgi:hypothetical protein
VLDAGERLGLRPRATTRTIEAIVDTRPDGLSMPLGPKATWRLAATLMNATVSRRKLFVSL